jgi:hypothetical protein
VENEPKRQMGVALPADLRQKLEAASEAADHSIAEEIRVRLERSFEGDQQTRIMADAVALIAAEVEKETGAVWHKHAGSWEMFAEALVTRLDLFKKPSGTTKFGDRPHQSVPENDPKFLGRWSAIQLAENSGWTNSSDRAAMEQGYRQMKELREKKT